MATKLNSPFAGRSYINAPPGQDAAVNPPGTVQLPRAPSQNAAGGAVLGRLAQAISKLPSSKAPSNRGHARNLFLP